MGIPILLQGWLVLKYQLFSFQLLHICIEGWGNWRWSEPFSVDNAGTFIRTIQYKGRTASLIIKVQQLSGVQKQVSTWSCLEKNNLSNLNHCLFMNKPYYSLPNETCKKASITVFWVHLRNFYNSSVRTHCRMDVGI